jgi:hypothetical protein
MRRAVVPSNRSPGGCGRAGLARAVANSLETSDQRRLMNKPRVLGIAAVLATALFVTIVAAPAPALADPGCATANVLAGSNFEIDVSANLKVDGASPCIDWLAGGTGSALRSGVLAKNDKPSGSNDDAFGQGTSENDANPTIVTGSIPPNKSDLKVFGVYSEVGTSTVDNPTGKFLELFWSRIQNPSGTTNMDFELNQKFCSGTTSDPNCADNGGVPPETPVRTAGDKLISYDLSQGGTVPTISIRTWDGSSWGLPTVITGGTQPRAVGSVNTSSIGSADTGGIGSQDPFTFGEAAIAVSALFPSGTCGTFGSAYLKSRASDSFSTEVKDFIAPERVRISSCETSISTTLSASTITVGQSVTDSATLTGATSNAGGTVTYSVFANNTCTGTPVASGGTKTVTNGVVPNSDPVTFNSAGTFYWQASYSGDANNLSAKSTCTSEQLIVNRKQPAISTTLSASAIIVGQSIHDSATLTGATSNAGGSVTYTVYSDSSCTTFYADGGTKTVTNGAVPDSNSVTFNSSGAFYWQASYSGDANNLSAKSTCTSEQLSVRRKLPAVSTTLSASTITVGQSAHDSATLTGATSNAGGTVTYTVYSDNQCTQNPVDAGTKTVTNGVMPDSNSVTFNSAGTFYWQASYSGDANNRPAKSACTSEQLTVQAKPTISTTLSANPIAAGQSIHDSATLTGATSNAGGTVTYTVYSNNQCTQNPVDAGTKTVTNGVVPDSDTITFNSAGTFYWQASYSGDANNLPAKSACTSEQLKVFGSCALGYPSGQPPALSSVVFNESEVLRASAAVPGGGSVAGPNDRIAVWYNDEHALTLGVRRVIVKTSSGTTTTDYPITPLNADPATHAGSATNPQVGTTSLGSGLFFPNTSGHNPQGFPNDQAGTDVVTWNSAYFFLDSGRPMWPALFITDITSDPSSRSGDWQQGGPAATPPNAIFGAWKGAVRTVDKTRTPYAITVTPDGDPQAKNNWNLGGGDPAPAGLKDEGYGAEARWNVSGLGLQAGHAYRLQFMVHDGDQNKTGGDSGEGCMNVVIPG